MSIKLLFQSMIILLTGGLASSCIVITEDGLNAERIYGSGTVISGEREVPAFDQIHLKGSGKVILTRAAIQNVRIDTDENIMPHIRTEVENGKLVISYERKNLKPTVLTIHITAADLEGVAIAGSGDIIGKDDFNSDSFYVDIAGSGDISLSVSAENLESSISGSGSIYLSGSTESYNATITGSGDIDAVDLKSNDTSVVITGSGNCRVNVSEQLRAKITGSGDVLYKGHPKISRSITGSGKVKDRN